ncbi:MAG: 4-(cytidine 5'-diphospho)-2-C-methyl-D-erythritol kinase [Flavobacteriales bacterium]|nr:4-(cytidine 5'-diphospho)-2-C-methyl-D-erythritol kinase [Flavobacteriales bacterium]MCW8913605.1 4-(cytidine 5'-diphospho)-2-C-methyl-D-erythritol kinase [Flavobacteriales bacterium]MCW8937109.1 4-(cytidine 5'-diphospho)-2-C-methyl-D-erythritol kinase [Flavobacteriales bacterium]MCW8939288.1 4-(cytidine 5'-diphospho)-2-C-methyl-D-erythritol kinase [Flavobacteriales bacterium]MCW8968838.1 4-(cytidine 5'-diphospho)-2-C-methyl-D-erythritol kinase [Flavobacteriales bacterium]
MIVFPNAKINIGLNVVEKRPDGFHNIESVFYPIFHLKDILEIILNTQSDKVLFSSSGIEIPGNKNENLCVKAYQLLKTDFDIPSVKIHLHKVIPIGAGLGGGSSDAAFTLKLLNTLFTLNLSEEKLITYAQKLGSDCAFFIKNKPVYAYNKGDDFTDYDLNLEDYKIEVLFPNIHVSTKEAYDGIQVRKSEIDLRNQLQLPIEQWKNVVKNDFEKSIFSKYKAIKEVKASLYNQGAVYASMTGSGSAVYGIFNK